MVRPVFQTARASRLRPSEVTVKNTSPLEPSALPNVRIEHLYAPYCAGFRIVRLLEKVYGLSVVPYNIIELRGQPVHHLPPYILKKYHEITDGNRVPYGGLFFVNGRYVGSAFQDTLFEELDRLGVPRVGVPFDPLPHPILMDQSQAEGTIFIRAVTQDDLSGHGNPSPAYCTELQFGSHGNPETIGLLAGWTGRYGCCMLGAYIRGQAAGFISFAPREELWRLGWFEDTHEAPAPGEVQQVLAVLCLHVYPGARQRGVATALLYELIEYARDHRYQKIVAYVGMRPMLGIGQSAGNRFPYEHVGFKAEPLVPPGEARFPDDTGSRQYQGLARLTFSLNAPR